MAETATTQATERVPWFDVVLYQRTLVGSGAYVKSVGYHPDYEGFLVFMGRLGRPIALVHDPAIGWDGSGTVEVEVR